jgi:hypothetical protein
LPVFRHCHLSLPCGVTVGIPGKRFLSRITSGQY